MGNKKELTDTSKLGLMWCDFCVKETKAKLKSHFICSVCDNDRRFYNYSEWNNKKKWAEHIKKREEYESKSSAAARFYFKPTQYKTSSSKKKLILTEKEFWNSIGRGYRSIEKYKIVGSLLLEKNKNKKLLKRFENLEKKYEGVLKDIVRLFEDKKVRWLS